MTDQEIRALKAKIYRDKRRDHINAMKRAAWAKNAHKHSLDRKRRYRNDPDYREAVKARANEYHARKREETTGKQAA